MNDTQTERGPPKKKKNINNKEDTCSVPKFGTCCATLSRTCCAETEETSESGGRGFDVGLSASCSTYKNNKFAMIYYQSNENEDKPNLVVLRSITSFLLWWPESFLGILVFFFLKMISFPCQIISAGPSSTHSHSSSSINSFSSC